MLLPVMDSARNDNDADDATPLPLDRLVTATPVTDSPLALVRGMALVGRCAGSRNVIGVENDKPDGADECS